MFILSCRMSIVAHKACPIAFGGVKRPLPGLNAPVSKLPQHQNQTTLSMSGKPISPCKTHSLHNNHRTLLPEQVCPREKQFSPKHQTSKSNLALPKGEGNSNSPQPNQNSATPYKAQPLYRISNLIFWKNIY